MIVQCEQCKTKYRIADDKIKDKSVKVRCAKCENVFTVTPPEKDTLDGPAVFPPSAPGPSDPLSSGEASPSEDRGLEPSASQPGEDMEPDGLTSPPIPEPSPSAEGEKDFPIPEERPEQFGTGSPSDKVPGSYLPPSPDEGSLNYGSPRPEHEMDHGETEEEVPPPEPPLVSEDSGFEIEGTIRERTSSGPDPFSDGMGNLAVPPAQPVDGEWGNISIDAPSDTDISEEAFGLSDSPGHEPQSPPPTEDLFDQELPDPLNTPTQLKEGTTTVSSLPAPAKSGGGKKGLLIVLLLALLGVGGYFAYPTVMGIIQSKTQQPAGTLTPVNVQVNALNRSDGKVIYSVRGEIKNQSRGSVGMIKVEAQFRNASGDVLARATSYCGNSLEDGKLVSGNLNQIKKDLQNELGQSLSNSNIPPGKTIPFLVVLDNPPAGVSKVTVTISSYKKTT